MSIVLMVVVSFGVALVASFLTTPISGTIARRFNVLDRPEAADYKKHSGAVPYLGGVAIITGVVVGWLVIALIQPDAPSVAIAVFSGAVATGVLLGLVGMVDDIRSVPRLVRLAVQIAAASSMAAIGFRTSFAPNEALDFVVTVVWIVGITNAFNLLDNMDGLTSGLAGLAALTFAAMGLVDGATVLPFLALALAGACFGFLGHNRYPARIFMGDAGSTFIGFLIAVIGLQVRFDNLLQVTFLIPVVVLALPILDTTLVVVSRMTNKRPLFLGGRDHISHRLVHLGLSVRVSVGVLYWAQICLGWLGMVIARSSVEVAWMLLSFVIAVGLFFMGCLLRVPVYRAQFDDTAELEEARDRGGEEYVRAVDNVAESERPEVGAHKR